MVTRIRAFTEVNLHGPLLDGKAGPIMDDFFRDAKKLVATSGRDELRQRATGKPRHPTGATAGAITIRPLKKGLTVITDYPEVLYGPWLEGTSSRNTSTRFKGYRMFRLTRGRLRRRVGHLVQGLLDQAVVRLNGGRR